jgi:putative transposase
MNAKRVYRLSHAEGLTLRRKNPKRRHAAVPHVERPAAMHPNDRWTMDFMSDALATGHTLRVLTVLDTCTRECVALEVATQFRSVDAAVLTRVGIQRELPRTIPVDYGPEFTLRALDHWTYRNQVRLDYIRPGKPTVNGVSESVTARVRQEGLSQHDFSTLSEARHVLHAWRAEYNTERPHSS